MIDNLHRVTQLILNGRKMKQMKEETKVFFSKKKKKCGPYPYQP